MKMWMYIIIILVCIYVLPPMIKNAIINFETPEISETPLVHGEYE